MGVRAIDLWDNPARDRLHEGARVFNPAHRWHFEMSVVEEAFDQPVIEFGDPLARRMGCNWDAVYLDSAHTYADALGAIRRWRSKIGRGGLFCGHDLTEHFSGVEQTVPTEFGVPLV